ncbi:hypothetical protein EGM97_00710 [Pseudomonas sp. AF32]|nr:hypothetical protein [Pseudomonas sp. AF32]
MITTSVERKTVSSQIATIECGSGLAREGGVPVSIECADTPSSRASPLPQGDLRWIEDRFYKIRTRNDRPLILPSFRRLSACLAMPRSTAT